MTAMAKLQPLNAQALALALGARARTASSGTSLHHGWLDPQAVSLCDETGSTNTDLMELGRSAGAAMAPSRRVHMARLQTAGRGRRGNAWHGSPDATLMMSLGMRIDGKPAGLTGLPLVCGLAIREALALQGAHAQLKWPNDVLDEHGAKLGGLLVELHILRGEPQAQCWVVVGLGLNRALEPDLRHVLADREITDLQAMGAADLDPHALIADWIVAIERSLATYLGPADASSGREGVAGFEPFVSAFDAVHAYHGKPVRISERDQVMAQGDFAGVGPDGEARVRLADGRVASFLSGDVSLRGME
jgi:BirA family biotin operon repressor/biotin-[acetyl-CoA-carboxylase] ligase